MQIPNNKLQNENRNFWRGATIRLRNMLYTNGAYFDELYFGLTIAEWDKIDPPHLMKRFSANGEVTPTAAN